MPCVSPLGSMMILECGDYGEYPEGRREREAICRDRAWQELSQFSGVFSMKLPQPDPPFLIVPSAAIEALKKAHREEMNKELGRTRSFQQCSSLPEALQKQHQ